VLQFGLVAPEEQLRAGLTIGALVKQLDSGGPVPLDVDNRDRLVGQDACDYHASFEVLQGGHARLSPWGNERKRIHFVICAAHIHPLWSLLDETPGMFSIRPF
jgi:hypothetical protein